MTRHIEDNHEHILEEALEQFIESQLWGGKSDIDELVRQYPQFEHQIKLRLRKIQRIDALFDTLVQPDDSDFEDIQTEQKLVGQKVGSFQITEMIGRGGMGVVYLAHDTKLKRPVAIKSIPAKLAADSTAQLRFRREAELLASLNHPNIAVIHEIIEEEKSGYLVLEHVPGQTLSERIAREPLTLKEALSIGWQVADAISAAHKKGVIHRDLKPGNIKITPESRVKVLDFGLAKLSVAQDEKSSITTMEPGRVVGTPAYMSPEQACSNETDHRTDVWSFGCIMYQMLTGHLPFEGETATDTLAQIIKREPDWERLPQDTPANIRTLLRHCLEKDPDHRLGDIVDVVVEITKTQSTPSQTTPVHLRRTAITIGVTVIIVLSGVAVWFALTKEARPSSKEIRLVVLPFENLGSVEDEYFANGITDEITARLASIHGLSVISRQSAMQHKKREKGAQQIGEELGVDYILEGTVQREQPSDPTSRVRIIPQLIRVADDAHVWAQTYDDDMSEVFRAQSNLADQVAQSLGITLLELERQALQFEPTENMEAYGYYLRGYDYYYYRDLLEDDYRSAIGMYEKAVELDPTFALAYCRLSDAHSEMYWMFYDRSKERLARAKQAADKAFQLNPHLPEVHIALGHYYYHGFLDYERALEQFDIARKSRPNSGEVLSWIAYVQRRQGKFEQALANFKKAFELDPLCNYLAFDIAQNLMMLRKYPEAENYYDRAISLAPDLLDPYSWKARLYLRWEGRTKKARAVLVEALQNPKSAENAGVVNTLINIDVFDANYQGALDRLSLNPPDVNDQHYFIPNALRYALIHEYMGNKDLSEKYYEEARTILQNKIQEDPNDARLHSSLGIAYAGLGRGQDAIREGKVAVELLSVSKEAWRGLNRVEDLARIYTMVGEYDLAIEQIEYLLGIPGEMSIPLLQLDPAWNPLRNHPHFQKLIEQGK